MTARRRVYKTVSVAGSGNGYEVRLDARPIRTPLKQPLIVPTHALAEAIAGEWEAQTDRIDPHTMILTKLANTAIDRVAPHLDRVRDDIVGFAESDLVCYRAAEPAELTARQALAWNPVLDWARTKLGADFAITEGVVHIAQPPCALLPVRRHIESLSHWELAGLHTITTLLGSALTGLRLLSRDMNPDDAWSAAHVDEDWQIAHWGEDEEAAIRRAARRKEFDAAWHFVNLARQ